MSANATGNKNPLLTHVARLYYVDNLTKLEIGKRLRLSRFKVARLLEEARAGGVVRVEIDGPLPANQKLAAELTDAYALDLALVVPEHWLARATAAWLVELLHPSDVVGVAWGRTLSRVVDELSPLQLKVPVVQVCGAIPSLEHGTSPTEVTLKLAERLGGTPHPLAAPAVTRAAARRDLLANPAVRPTVDLFERVTLVLVGIGTTEAPGAGHILAHIFDEDGALLERESAAISLSVPQLAAARVLAVAGGAEKEGAVGGALRTGLLDILVTDEVCARAALQ